MRLFKFYTHSFKYSSYSSSISRNCKNDNTTRRRILSLLSQTSNLLDYSPHSLNEIQNPNFLIPYRSHLSLSHNNHHHDQKNRHDSDHFAGENIFLLGLAADIGLAGGKALTGYLSGSTAIIADAAHSVSDVVLSGVALWSYKAGNAPRDEEHPYGHGKFESLGALGISCMLMATAGGIAWHAVDILLGLFSAAPDIASHSLTHSHMDGHGHNNGGHRHGVDMDHPVLALSMTLVSISVKEGLYWITKRAGEKQGSGLMKANAWHHRADAISSVVTLIGVGGSILGIKFLDPLAGLVVSGMILKAGLETGYQSVMELVDAAIPADQVDHIKRTILQVEGVKGCHRLRGRRAGSSLYLDVHIEVNPFLSVSAAHGLGEHVRKQIHKCHPEIAEVFIHIDPSYSGFTPSMLSWQENSKGAANRSQNVPPEDKDIKAIVADVFSSDFYKTMEVARITRHYLQGKTLLEITVSTPPDIMVKDAMDMAESAEKDILKAAPNVTLVFIQLGVGSKLP